MAHGRAGRTAEHGVGRRAQQGLRPRASRHGDPGDASPLAHRDRAPPLRVMPGATSRDDDARPSTRRTYEYLNIPIFTARGIAPAFVILARPPVPPKIKRASRRADVTRSSANDRSPLQYTQPSKRTRQMERCTMNGQHTKAEYATECPLLGRTRASAWPTGGPRNRQNRDPLLPHRVDQKRSG